MNFCTTVQFEAWKLHVKKWMNLRPKTLCDTEHKSASESVMYLWGCIQYWSRPRPWPKVRLKIMISGQFCTLATFPSSNNYKKNIKGNKIKLSESKHIPKLPTAVKIILWHYASLPKTLQLGIQKVHGFSITQIVFKKNNKRWIFKLKWLHKGKSINVRIWPLSKKINE